MLSTTFKMDEEQRLRALRRYGILDTPPETGYDDIVRLAAALCDVPIALISLVDVHRQWFKANVGLPGVSETERCVAFCSHAIEEEGLFIVEDATKDSRFVDNPLVLGEPFIRFYAGAPIESEDGYRLGTLCIIDRTPRELGEDRKGHLLALKRQVELLLRLRLQVREAEARTLQLLECSSDAVFLLNEAGNMVESNPVARRLLGLDEATPSGASFEALVLPSERDAWCQARQEVLSRGTACLVDLGLSSARGERISLDVAVSLQAACDERRLLVVGKDLTEQRRLEQQSIQNDRLAAVGAMAAGIAHEINNPVSYVLSNLGFLQGCRDELARELAALPSGPPTQVTELLDEAREVISESLDGCKRIRDIVQDMRFFSHAPDDVLTPVDVNAILDFALRMADMELRRTARLERRYDASLPPAIACESRLSQIFLNLIVNAVQAMQPGEPQRHVLCVCTSREGEHVRIEVSDTGHGIPPEVLPRIFDPFFTTKPVGVGTGLGLSISHSLLVKMGGTLRVRSEQGQGSTFTLLLPTRERNAEQPAVPVRSV